MKGATWPLDECTWPLTALSAVWRSVRNSHQGARQKIAHRLAPFFACPSSSEEEEDSSSSSVTSSSSASSLSDDPPAAQNRDDACASSKSSQHPYAHRLGDHDAMCMQKDVAAIANRTMIFSFQST